MLQKLSISNYALIASLSVDFDNGFSVITGETGAGKSILLGALGFVLGNRADSNILFDETKKCVVEATFFLQDTESPSRRVAERLKSFLKRMTSTSMKNVSYVVSLRLRKNHVLLSTTLPCLCKC